MEEEVGEEETEAPRSRKRERSSPDRASPGGEQAEDGVLPDPGKKKRRKGVVYRDKKGECRTWGGHHWWCEHGRERKRCKECGGSGICEHNRERSRCKECGGGSICEHNRVRSVCKDCLSLPPPPPPRIIWL